MTRRQILAHLAREIRELMGTLSIDEITRNHALIEQIETVLGVLTKTA